MTDSYQPRMLPQRPEDLPGTAGFICYRKLKRRYRWHNEGVWPKPVADLQAGGSLHQPFLALSITHER